MSVKTKQELRAYYKQIRSNLTAPEKERIDNKVYSCFVQNDYYYKCDDILVYVSGPPEIDTYMIMRYVLKDSELEDKRLLCPRCEKGTNIMHFYWVKSFDDLEKGAYGIMEPKAYCERVDEFNSPMCVVPGLSFDMEGYRLGYGKGFYDRFLANFKGITVGLCCDSCIAEESLPRNEFDISVDYIATESGWIKRPSRKI
ncbi:5-formyltetrahydrofolate cyclo-ligase [Ruminococcus sp.]|uniref:5-formyltetrahydrofolate cyclo-ligase n=1 Tax=Ruminococcus sp. TaxID=41978 RepID=UPI0025FE4A0D|nr:5-formyltetrahydrofolate cyclo-ligase [Ruminococcus sp.]MBQ8965227.1 5-formyltetrahydrofolate cyclo-ligase [Ruminococcus sp.]